MSLKTRGILVVAIGTVLAVALSAGGAVLRYDPVADRDLPMAEARLLAEVMRRVREDYVEPVSDEALLDAAVRGMVSALDAHSEFLDSTQFEDIRISTTGNYSGVGIEVSFDDDAVVVVAPFDDTPAQRAGILPGDVILSIDGFPVDAEPLTDAINRMRGKPGSRVTLAVLRDGIAEPLTFNLTRAYVRVVSARETLLEPDYGYVRVSQFSETTARDLRKALKRLRGVNDGPLQGLVLDLRNNPGGVLDAAVQVSDHFLEDGVIVSANGRSDHSRFTHTARRGDLLDGAELVVLVNEGSASASEIVAGALQDQGRATIVGTTTFGKGSVQTVMPLSDGNAVKLTTSRYYTPSGVSIHGTGIRPDFEVLPGDDPLDYALGRLSGVPDIAADAQLERALELVKQPFIMHSKAP
ncbi:MAG: S41 family peptidase [Pseudomonadota bacterium]